MIRVEPLDQVVEFGGLGAQQGDLLLALVEQCDAFAPGEQTVGSGKRESADEQQETERGHPAELLPHDPAVVDAGVHALRESQLARRFKRFPRKPQSRSTDRGATKPNLVPERPRGYIGNYV